MRSPSLAFVGNVAYNRAALQGFRCGVEAMAVSVFTPSDFRIFEIPGFAGRMQAIAQKIRPKLTALGEALPPGIGRHVGAEVFAHVAKHARRTVNPPEDTWVAFGPDPRGYKKHVHFKVAISRNCVRCLFEVGPEHQDKRGWAMPWERRIGHLITTLSRSKGISWFKDEHDEDSVAVGKDLGPERFRTILQDLCRRRDGQLVLGRRLSRAEVTGMTSRAFQKATLDTFRVLSPLYRR
jgi:uncharacterized protein YktB (UPF0637 family)